MRNTNRKDIPILFLGGAAKSGTTFLFHLLSKHSKISASIPKETYFFMDENHPLLHKKKNIYFSEKNAFFEYFPINSDTRLLLEATPHLIYQQQIETLFASFPQAKFLFLLREPADRIRSSFEYTKYNQANFIQEVNFIDYAKALLDKDEKRIASWSRSTSQFVLAQELYISTYHMHVTKWLRVFGAERVRFIQFETLLTEKERVLSQILNWLNLEEENLQFGPQSQNSTHHLKYPSIHAALNKIVQGLPHFPLRNTFKQFYYKNVKKTSYKDETIAEGLALLRTYFQEHNVELAQLIPINMEKWEH